MLSYKCTTEYPVRAGEVQFGLLSSKETRKMSTVQIKDTTIYYRGLPNPYGINDHRMGTVDRRLLCGTCCRDVKECQGHVGHIELAFPMYHIGFFDMCFKTLRCVCFTCSKILLTEEEIQNLGNGEGKTRFQAVYNTVKARKKCSNCGMTQPTYTRLSLSIRCDWPNEVEWESDAEKAYCTAPFTQRDALSILSHISERDVTLLGFNEFCRPGDLVMMTVLVPPPVARPAIMASEGSRSRGQDDLTHKLQDINKRSIEVQAAIGEQHTWQTVPITPEFQDRLTRLQFEVFTYMNNNIRGQKQSTQRSGAPTKSITDRLRGKDGRIRGNLMGKRVDFSARSVITPDAVMDVDQVGIPYKVAMSLTVPERVTSYNIEKLTARIANGPTHIFGAETVITSNGVMISLAHCENRDKIRLQFGWVVERFLCDDDVVIFNRQPSLHKVGMMGHRVKLMPGNTFRLNLCCANPYNADFDGDEMNLHVPQSPAATADVATLMMVSRQIISPQANRPVMGIVQDSLLGAHLFSSDDILLNRHDACHILAHVKYTAHTLPPPCVVKPIERWTGKQLLSLLLPDNLRMGAAIKSSAIENHHKVLVRDGRILLGVLKKATLGTSAGGFVDMLFRQYGSSKTVQWMSDIQRLVNSWLCLRGFSVGVSDCVLSARGEERVKERINTAMQYAMELVHEPVTEGTDEARVLEGTVVRILSKCLMHTGGIVDEELGGDNSIRKMVQAGSKGNPINLSQICGCVGQQSVEGRRVFAEKGGRTLSCFEKKDKTLAGKGFVQNSYALGLHPHEYFFHAMGGREGLVDTAVKTATTGYIQRRQMKSMEDHKVCYDGTVRNAEEAIVDFSYGGDGMDPTRVERIVLPLLEQSEEALAGRFAPWELKLVLLFRQRILMCKAHQAFDARVLLPFSPMRICMKRSPTPATMDKLEEILRKALDRQSGMVIRAGMLDFFNTGVLSKHGVSETDALELFEKLHRSVATARVNYGEMVGSIAAQSIGEPCTQMSVPHACTVLLKQDGKTINVPIGEIIDAYLPPILSNDQHDVVPVSNLKCPGVSPTENVTWANVTHVSRHPANGNMVVVKTERGRTVKATASHSFLVREKNRVVQRTGADLVVGDCLPIVKELPINEPGTLPWSPIPLTRATGRFIGAIVSEGTICKTNISFVNTEHQWLIDIMESFANDTGLNAVHKKSLSSGGLGTLPMLKGSLSNNHLADWMAEHFGRTSFNKKLPAWILDAPDEFVTGLLQTYFDGDGNVQTETRHHRLCCHSVSTELVTMLCLCLARYGIVTYVGTEPYKTPAGEPGTIHRITIPMCFAAKFQEYIGFGIERKAEKLAEVVKKQEAVGMRGFQAHIPGMNEVLEEVRSYVPPGGDKNSFETLLRKEFRRIQRKTGITPKMLMRCREHAVKFNAPDELVAELDQAINADVWWDPIVSIEIEKDSTEMVYDFTVDEKLQSFMLANGVFVHNTLNSVDWNTSMVIHWTGKSPPPVPHNAEVGALIDALIEEHQSECQVQPDGKTIYLPLACGTALALSPDENGKMVWTELEAVTRHPPINKDGSNTLVEVTTDSGRTVTVTKGKSLLVERDGKLVEIDGDEVIVGDRVPVVQELPSSATQDTLDLHTIFSEAEAIFTNNTMIEAIEAAKHNRHWFVKGGFKGRSCYSRSDISREAVKHRPVLLEADQVVWSHGGASLPMHVPLDREFGFFIGAYLAEGCVSDHQVHIANVDPAYRDAARVWPDRFGIKCHVTNEKHQHKINGTSISIMFHSTILVELMKRTCGRLSAGKRVPGFAFAAPDAFVRGLLDGYISGDGTVSRKPAMIAASSRSQKLRDGIALLLTRFKVHCRLTQTRVSSRVTWTTNEDGERTQAQCGNMEPMYHLMIPAAGTRRFAENVDLTLAHKQERCSEILVSAKRKPSKTYDNLANVSLEEIVALNEVASSHEFVYDLTVAGTRNMTAVNGLALADTFHFAGVSAKNVTLGIPRLKELLDQAKSIKTPSNRIFFKSPLDKSEEFASFFAATLPLTRLGDIVSSCDFVYDPDPHVTVVEADAFMVAMNERIGQPVNDDVSRYVIRLILNQSVMNARRITPPMVRKLLRNRLRNRAHIISSETNCVDWTIRIRFEDVTKMMRVLDSPKEREGLLCYRVVSVMLDTIAISGHVHIASAHVATVDGPNGDKTFVVDTQGCSLIDLSAACCVDWFKTTSNDVNEVHASLGIEAAVNVLFQELTTTISFDGTYVDPRHIMMIVNTMTRGGYIMPLSRHGINRMDTGPLLRCSFEETPDILCDAACFGERDNGRGVSQNIMTGKLPEIGSGAMHIKVAPQMMHPRDTLQQNVQKKRVLKSTVRRRDNRNDAVEFQELERAAFFSNTTDMQIEAPFASTEFNASAPPEANIFSTNDCQAPYIDAEMTDGTQRVGYASPSKVRREYRPSSPTSDSE